MKRSTQLILLLVTLLVVLTAIFLLLDFRLLQGQMAVNSSTSTFAFGVDEQSRLPLNQEVDLYVQAPQEFEDKLVEALREALRTNPYLGENNPEINPDAESLVAAEGSVLVIEIEEPMTFFWTPFYARAEMTVQVAYASDGEVTWIDEDVVAFETTDPPEPVVRVRATHQFSGSAYGLISLPGYASYLSNEVATQIDTALANSLAAYQ